MMKKLFALLLSLLLLTAPVLAENTTYALGDEVEDFTLTTWNGAVITLSELLQANDMVLLHFFDLTDAACVAEIAHLQDAYEAYADLVEIVAVTVEDVSDGEIGAFVTAQDVTFPVCRDNGLAARFQRTGKAMSCVIDSASTMMYLKNGAFDAAEDVTEVFAVYTNAANAVAPESVPASRVERKLTPNQDAQPQDEIVLTPWGNTPSDIPAADPDAVNAALNRDGASLVFTTPDGVWPMILAENEGESGVISTNVLQDNSRSAVATTVNARAGDVLSITFTLSSEAAYDRFEISLNGEIRKVFTGEKSMTWACSFPANGAYEVELAYVKNGIDASGEDSLFIGEVAHLTGADAEGVLMAQPAWPESAAITLVPVGARPIGFDDPTFALTTMFGLADYYIASGGVTFNATINADVDPGAAYITTAEEIGWPLDTLLVDGAFTVTLPVNPDATYTAVALYPDSGCDLLAVRQVIIFPSEDAVKAFIADLAETGTTLNGWWYAESTDAEQ